MSGAILGRLLATFRTCLHCLQTKVKFDPWRLQIDNLVVLIVHFSNVKCFKIIVTARFIFSFYIL